MLVQRCPHSNCDTIFSRRTFRAFAGLLLCWYRRESSSEAATRKPTKYLACRNREQQKNLDWNRGHRTLSTCYACRRLGFSIGRNLDATPPAILHDRPKFSSIMLLRRRFSRSFSEVKRLSTESAKKRPSENGRKPTGGARSDNLLPIT